MDFWWVLAPKLRAKLTKKSIIGPLVGKLAEIAKILFGPSAFQLRSEIDKRASPGRSKFKQKFGQHLDPFLMDFETSLGRFWEAFGGQVGAMLAPNGIKTRPQNQSEKRMLFGRPPDRFWVDFGAQHPKRGPKV